MKRCPDCKAPNPQARTVCYACGQNLSKPPKNAVAPGARTFPCLNCAGEIPFGAGECPHCGRSITLTDGVETTPAAPAARRVLSPEGWNIEPLPDGTVRLSRTSARRLWRDASGLSSVVAIAAFLVFFGVVPRAGDASGPGIPVFAFVLGGALLVGAAVWAFGGREELRAGPGLIEVKRSWGPWTQSHRMQTSGVFRVGTRQSRTGNGAATVRRILWAENLGKRIEIDAASATAGRSMLTATLLPNRYDSPATTPLSAPLLVEDDPHFLGRYLASVTGWSFIDPEIGLY